MAQLSEARKLSIHRCMDSLAHSCQCTDANCRLPSCQKMKRVVQHNKICKRKTNGGCPVCKQLIVLCCYHAKHCRESKCTILLCSNIKHKLELHQLRQRLQQLDLLCRPMAAMSIGTSIGMPTPAPALPLLATISQGVGGPGVMVAAGGSAAGTGQENKQALQQLLNVLKSPNTPEQQQQILQILKNNPQLMAAFIKKRQMYQQSQQN